MTHKQVHFRSAAREKILRGATRTLEGLPDTYPFGLFGDNNGKFSTMNLLRLLLAACAVLASAGEIGAQSDPAQRGRALVVEVCGQCHSVDKAGRSPRTGTLAFRDIDLRVDLDGFTERLRKGLESDHADMPRFRFTREDARAIVAFLRSIQAP